MIAPTIFALASAGLHAGWNLIAKRSPSGEMALVGQFSATAVLAGCLIPFFGLPGWQALPWIVGSACVHVIYVEWLIKAYEHGDFSFAYPMARGGGALVSALGGALLLGDAVHLQSWLAIGVVAAGIIALVGTQPPRNAVVAAVATAVCIGVYTNLDSYGARHALSGQSYGISLLCAVGSAIALTSLARGRGPRLVASLRGDWWRYLLAAVFGISAYTLVLVAVRSAPVGYVTMLRESSVVFAALLGWVLLKEKMGARRLMCSGVILAGLIWLISAGG